MIAPNARKRELFKRYWSAAEAWRAALCAALRVGREIGVTFTLAYDAL
jgi:hypothetical protein